MNSMKKISLYIITLTFLVNGYGQETIYPAPAQQEGMAYTNATIHVGNGQVINNGTVIFEKGKITYAGAATTIGAGVRQVDATGKHIYPGVILAKTNLGLVEVGAGTRATNDVAELGLINPNVKSIVAYNTDSKIINTLRSNGILLAGITPQGGLISGTSTVVQLDAWNWEDAAYKNNVGLHFNMPSLLNRPNPFGAFFGQQQQQGDRIRTALDRIESVKQFFLQAKAYNKEGKHASANLKYEAVKGLFDKSQK